MILNDEQRQDLEEHYAAPEKRIAELEAVLLEIVQEAAPLVQALKKAIKMLPQLSEDK